MPDDSQTDFMTPAVFEQVRAGRYSDADTRELLAALPVSTFDHAMERTLFKEVVEIVGQHDPDLARRWCAVRLRSELDRWEVLLAYQQMRSAAGAALAASRLTQLEAGKVRPETVDAVLAELPALLAEREPR